MRRIRLGRRWNWVRRRAREVETIRYLDVLLESRELNGVVSLKETLIAPGTATISELMNENVKTVQMDSTPHKGAGADRKYDSTSVPVLEMDGRMAGIIAGDDILELFIRSDLCRKRRTGA